MGAIWTGTAGTLRDIRIVAIDTLDNSSLSQRIDKAGNIRICAGACNRMKRRIIELNLQPDIYLVVLARSSRWWLRWTITMTPQAYFILVYGTTYFSSRQIDATNICRRITDDSTGPGRVWIMAISALDVARSHHGWFGWVVHQRRSRHRVGRELAKGRHNVF